MNRVIRFDPEILAWARTLTPEDRLRQASAAFRLYHALHRPFETPFSRGFDSLEEFFRYEEEARHRG